MISWDLDPLEWLFLAWLAVLLIVLLQKWSKFRSRKQWHKQRQGELQELCSALQNEWGAEAKTLDSWTMFNLPDRPTSLWLGFLSKGIFLKMRLRRETFEQWPDFFCQMRKRKGKSELDDYKPGLSLVQTGDQDWDQYYGLWLKHADRRKGLPKAAQQFVKALTDLPGSQNFISVRIDHQGCLITYQLTDPGWLWLQRLILRSEELFAKFAPIPLSEALDPDPRPEQIDPNSV